MFVARLLTRSGLRTPGDVELIDLRINDFESDGQGPLDVHCPSSTIPVGGAVVCTATYTVVEADHDCLQFMNVAEAVAKNDMANVISNDSGVDLQGFPQGSGGAGNEGNEGNGELGGGEVGLELEKTASVQNLLEGDEGITYFLEVRNMTGETVTDLEIVEEDFDGVGTLGLITCGQTQLQDEDQTLCTAEYQVARKTSTCES